MLEDAAPMAAAEHLGQAVMEFDANATVETVVIQQDQVTEETEETTTVEITEEVSEVIEEVTPESEDKSDEAK
jgi:segregation and condensation protein B